MVALFNNNAYTTLASGITNSATTINVTTGEGARFPSPTGSDYFYATLIDTANNLEIVKCTARTTDALTVVRAQEGTSAQAYSAADRLELRVTAAGLGEFAVGPASATDGSLAKFDGTTGKLLKDGAVIGTDVAAPSGVNAALEFLAIAASDEATDLTTGTAKATFHMPYAFTLTDVQTGVTTAPTGATLVVDINEAGATILSTKISIDIGEKTSQTAATPPVISDTALAAGALMTVDIDQVGSTVAGTGLKVYLVGRQT